MSSNNDKKKPLSQDELNKLRGSLSKAIETVDPKLLGVRGGTAPTPGVDVNVCKTKCM